MTGEEITPEHVARRWRLRGVEHWALANRAALLEVPKATAKLHLAHMGLVLAWADSDEWPALESAELARRLTARAIRYARQALADCAPATHDELDSQTIANESEAETLFGLAEEPFAPGFGHVPEFELLLHVATSAQEHWLLRGFLEEGCSNFAAVDRLYGWTDGQARSIASRLRRKARGAA